MSYTRNELYIGGRWVAPHGTQVIEVENPATEEIIGTVPLADESDVDRAVRAARDAFPSWSQTSPSERADVLRALGRELAARKDEIASTVTDEIGAPRWIAQKIHASLPVTVVEAYADLVEKFQFEKLEGSTLIRYESAGVVGAITPWNYPLSQITAKLAPVLASGATFVLKPSELSPFTAYLLFDALHAAGIPEGVVNLVTGYGASTGEALVGHSEVDVVSFTGSLGAGRRVAEVAARNITRVTLELGGKSANVVLDDAELATAVKVGVANAFLNGGQTCTAWTRLLVPQARYDEAVELAAGFANRYQVGDPTDPATKLGPVVSSTQQERIRQMITQAVSEGASVAAGGPEAPEGLDRGYYVRPTILRDVHPDSMIAQEEVFGPVLSVIAYSDDEDAIAIANNSKYGLHGGVWSADEERARRVADRMRTGSVDINGAAYNPMAPFGGYKRSGYGREMGGQGMLEFLEMKSIGLR